MRILAFGAAAAATVALLTGSSAHGISCASDPRYVQPSLAADGRSIAYVRETSAGCYETGPLFVAPTRPANKRPSPRELTTAGLFASAPLLAPNGTRVAFTNTGFSPPVLQTIRVDGTELRTIGPGTSPTFSPDGSRLAYVAPDGSIRVVERDGNQRLDRAGNAVTWSPDGTRLAIVSDTGIEVASADPPRVSQRISGRFSPPLVWSADSRRVAVKGVDGRAYAADLGPDGRVILYGFPASKRPLGFSRDGRRLVLLGGRVVDVASGRTAGRISPEEDVLTASIDGSSFAVGVPAGPPYAYTGLDLYVVDARGRGPRLVTPPRCGLASPERCRDGTDANDVLRDVHTAYAYSGDDRLLNVVHAEGGFGSDVLVGTPRNDVLIGQHGNDRIDSGGSGWDIIRAGSGSDFVDARGGARGAGYLNLGPGNDLVYAYDGQRDSIDCGTGRDTAYVDPRDRPTPTCERVLRRPAPRRR